MARAKKEAALTPEERLQAALVPDWEWPYKLPGNWCWTYLTKAAECLDNFRKPINATERAGRNGNVPYYGATGQVGWIDDFLTDEDLVLLGEDKAFTGELTAKWREEHGVRMESWEKFKFNELGTLERGRSKLRPRNDPKLFGGKYPFIQTGDVARSGIDNRVMKVFLEKMRPDTFLVLAGDTYQIESIDFGNWFTYAKDIIKTKGSNVELVSTWRTKDPGLIALWNETRNKGALITEKLVIDGPFSENIGEGVLYSEIMDEVILCLNYDGKFGLNNMNSYFQNANTETAVVWRDWKYKVGDHILFNDTDRFSLLYNNLKGRIVQIELFDSRIRFTVDVEIPLTEQDCQNDGIEFIDIIDDVTRIRFDVFDFEEEMADEDRKKAIVPFQLAYAVSIHKAQGLEYRSVKVVIPSSNAEKITHGIFYTAITRAKEKLKIYWSSETMQEVVAGFSIDTSRQKSLAIIKEKLKQDKNT